MIHYLAAACPAQSALGWPEAVVWCAGLLAAAVIGWAMFR